MKWRRSKKELHQLTFIKWHERNFLKVHVRLVLFAVVDWSLWQRDIPAQINDTSRPTRQRNRSETPSYQQHILCNFVIIKSWKKPQNRTLWERPSGAVSGMVLDKNKVLRLEDNDKDMWSEDKDKDLKIDPRGRGLSSRTTTLVEILYQGTTISPLHSLTMYTARQQTVTAYRQITTQVGWVGLRTGSYLAPQITTQVGWVGLRTGSYLALFNIHQMNWVKLSVTLSADNTMNIYNII